MPNEISKKMIEELFEEGNNRVERNPELQSDRADDVYSLFWEEHSTPSIEPMNDKAELYEVGKHEIDDNTQPFTKCYGIDAGSWPKPVRLVNDTTLNLSIAKFGHRDGNVKVTKEETSALVICGENIDRYENQHINKREQDFRDSKVQYNSHLILTPVPDRIKSDDWSKRACMNYTISSHLNKYSDVIDGPLFIDGPLYNYGIINLMNRIDNIIIDGWERMISELTYQRLKSIQNIVDSGYPVMGVTKTMSGAELVSEAGDRVKNSDRSINFPWNSDYAFLSSLIGHSDKFIFTPWFNKYPNFSSDKIPTHEVVNKHGEAIDMTENKRCFFYLRHPDLNTIFRVECPRIILDDSNEDKRKKLQSMIIHEFARSSGVPIPIKRADKDCEVPPEYKDKVRDFFEQEVTTDYNRDIRWKSLYD